MANATSFLICRWGNCGAPLAECTASAVEKHLKERHLSPWDARNRTRCQWNVGGCGCAMTDLEYARLGQHISRTHLNH
ncbi:uncharacterized protein LAESUDRAFT_721825 [Laetiporus sulphureus 93-53]|uniref:Uncharacterized protein n=1 Tax=Laetiporus sulphureus 93-53 TaxID=1314785 RepID=A0A165GK30_9APHY|nr:uncharacterized protein LAESUDRAFT_721825 [Laetiporus sulphureus 93-53]KZT10461.1 hypothetical protein LAESUDRAFT_721825 [Laetiporus sulphureus 93-53]